MDLHGLFKKLNILKSTTYLLYWYLFVSLLLPASVFAEFKDLPSLSVAVIGYGDLNLFEKLHLVPPDNKVEILNLKKLNERLKILGVITDSGLLKESYISFLDKCLKGDIDTDLLLKTTGVLEVDMVLIWKCTKSKYTAYGKASEAKGMSAAEEMRSEKGTPKVSEKITYIAEMVVPDLISGKNIIFEKDEAAHTLLWKLENRFNEVLYKLRYYASYKEAERKLNSKFIKQKPLKAFFLKAAFYAQMKDITMSSQCLAEAGLIYPQVSEIKDALNLLSQLRSPEKAEYYSYIPGGGEVYIDKDPTFSISIIALGVAGALFFLPKTKFRNNWVGAGCIGLAMTLYVYSVSTAKIHCNQYNDEIVSEINKMGK